MLDQTVMFILQGCFAVLMLFFGIILNTMRQSIDTLRTDLKLLNDAVLSKYVQHDDLALVKDASERKWETQRKLDHDLRGLIHALQLELERLRREVALKMENPK